MFTYYRWNSGYKNTIKWEQIEEQDFPFKKLNFVSHKSMRDVWVSYDLEGVNIYFDNTKPDKIVVFHGSMIAYLIVLNNNLTIADYFNYIKEK